MKKLVILSLIILGAITSDVRAESDYMSVLKHYQNTPQTTQQKVNKHYLMDKNGNKTGYVITNPDKSVSIYDMDGKLIRRTTKGSGNSQTSQKKLTSYKDIKPAKQNRRALQNLF